MSGFNSKREAAADKMQEPMECLDCGSHNVGVPANYDSLVDSVKAQPAQKPPSEWAGIKAILDEYGLQAIGFVADFKAVLAQPAQEPRNVRERWNVELDGNDLLVCFNDHEKGDKCQYERYSPQREWVGLTETERNDLEDYCEMIIGKAAFDAIEAKLKERNHGT